MPSVVIVEMTDANGTVAGLGSGFVVADGLIVTNNHVVRAGRNGTVALLTGSAKHDILGIAGLDPARDIAVLKVESLQAPPLLMSDSSRVEIGQTVYVVGNPHGLTGTFSDGIVSAIRVQGSDTLIQITAPISPGSSGGPVLDDAGHVVGVATATLRGGQNLNFAVPTTYAARLLRGFRGTTAPLATARSTAAARTAAWGRGATDGVVGAEFVWESSIMLDVIFGHHGTYSFSLRNKLDTPVEKVRSIVVFKDARGEPLEVSVPTTTGVIPPKLARRVSGKVDGEVQSLTTPDDSRRPYPRRVEIRVLDYQVSQ